MKWGLLLLALPSVAHAQAPEFIAYGFGQIRLYQPATDRSRTMPVELGSRPSLTADARLIAGGCTSPPYGENCTVRLYEWRRRRFLNLPGLDHPDFLEYDPSISGDGRLIAYTSFEFDNENVRLYDRLTDQRIKTRGLNRDGFDDREPALSADGRWLAFASDRFSPNPDPDGCEGFVNCEGLEIFVYDLHTDTLVDLPRPFLGQEPSLSGDGRLLAFASSRDIEGGAGDKDIFLYDLVTDEFIEMPGLNTPVDKPFCSHRCRSFQPSISDDGRFVAFGRVGIHEGALSGFVYDRETESILDLPVFGRYADLP